MAARLPAPERRRQLLDVAVDVFARSGFHDTSMNEVAEAAGVTKPVLYQHFRSKRQLYRELLEDTGERLLLAITTATAVAPGPREQVTEGFGAYFRFVADERSAFLLLFGSGAEQDPEFAGAVRRIEAMVADAIAPLIEAGLDEEHRSLLAHALVGLAEAASRRWLGGELDVDPEVLAAQVADLAWGGLRSVRPVRSPLGA